MRAGLDIGGTKTDAVAMDDTGRIVRSLRLSTGFGPDAILATAVEAVRRLCAETGIAVAELTSVGIGIPGNVDPATGRVTHAVNLGVDTLDLGARLRESVGCAVRVENDVNAAALGAFHLLGFDDSTSMAYLNLGTGLAAGIVLNGRLLRGLNGAAGEIGHVPVDPTGPVCACGQRGCLELYASGSAVARQWPTSDPQPARTLLTAAAAGLPEAIAVRDRLSASIAAAVRLLALTVDVDRIVIGGGLSHVGDELLPGVRATIAGWEQESPFIASLALARRLRLLPAGLPAAAAGAAFVGMASVPFEHSMSRG